MAASSNRLQIEASAISRPTSDRRPKPGLTAPPVSPGDGRRGWNRFKSTASRGRRVARQGQEAIAEAAHRLDPVRPDLLAQPADEHLDGVAVAVEVLVVQ